MTGGEEEVLPSLLCQRSIGLWRSSNRGLPVLRR